MRRRMRREDRRVVAVLGFLHGTVHANILSIPLFLLAWHVEFGADNLTLGLLAASAYSLYGIGAVPFGFLADRRAPDRLLLLCASGIAGSMAAVAASPSVPILAVSLGALGLFSGAYHPTGLSVISRTVTEQGRGMGWHGMGGSLGIAAGPAYVGGTIAFGSSWRLVAGSLILPAVIASVLLLVERLPRGVPKSPAGPGGARRALASRPYRLILFVYMFAGFAYQGGLTFLPRFIGAGFFAAALGLGAVGQVFSGTLADRPRPDRPLFALSATAAGSLAAAGILLVTGLGPPFLGFTAVAVGFGFLLFSLEALQNTLVTREAPREVRGLAFGFTFLSVFGIGAMGATLAGYLLDRSEAPLLFGLLAGSLATSGAFAYAAGQAGGEARSVAGPPR